MMMIKLITIFAAILIHSASGEKCTNNGNTTYFKIQDCDGDSYQSLARDFEMEDFVWFDAHAGNNEFPMIDDKMFRNMINLAVIFLDECKIEEIDENAFASLKVLILLSLWGNKIKSFHVNTFSNLGNLKGLFLSRNQIKELPAKLFKRNLNLGLLDLQQNEIKELPAGLFGTLTELELLGLNENQLEVLHGSTFQNNKKMTKLYLHFNKIEAVAAGTFDSLTKLTVLNLRSNTYINKLYVSNYSNKTIDLAQVSSDLSACYTNYEKYAESSTSKIPLDRPSPSDSSPAPLKIYAAIVIILLIIAIIVMAKWILDKKSSTTFTMERRTSSHDHNYRHPESKEI
jgi:hypothetical protein